MVDLDGILLLLILFWLFKSLIKRIKTAGQENKKRPEGAVSSTRPANESERRARAQRAVRMQEELKRREEARKLKKEKLSVSRQPVDAPSGEGMSAYVPSERVPMYARPAYAGSLGGDSTEGEDICDPELGHDRERPRRPAPESVYANEIGKESMIDLRPQALLQGVVMSEILTRPSERKWSAR